MEALVVLGNQLFPPKHLKPFKNMPIFMAEDVGLSTYFKFHKQKIVLFFSAMRHYRDQLGENNFSVDYFDIDNKKTYLEKLEIWAKKQKIKKINLFEIEDKFMEDEIIRFGKDLKIEISFHPSPMFMCHRQDFKDYLKSKKKPFMKSFYEERRRKWNIMMEESKPKGGKYSFDESNRKKLPKNYTVPKPFKYNCDSIDKEVIGKVEHLFTDHPGQASDFEWPTTRAANLKLLSYFLDCLFDNFGPYQDAISSKESFLHHSRLSPGLNLGLITPEEITEQVLKRYNKGEIPIESAEGFIRQIIGWREFVRGIYQNYSDRMDEENFWQAKRGMKECWYDGSTGLPPLDNAIKIVNRYGYNNHIERLMILANLMNLCEIEPKQAHSWFMEMYVDSSDWVMAANVYGMGLMSEGGIFATKPYISGSNYILKMSDYKKGEWCDIWDGLYWRFVAKHYNFFSSNPRMRMMTNLLDKMSDDRKDQIFPAAEKFLKKVTHND